MITEQMVKIIEKFRKIADFSIYGTVNFTANFKKIKKPEDFCVTVSLYRM
jgi:hypothetical protein